MEKNNKKYLILLVGIIGLIITSIGLTYAIWRITKEQTGENIVGTDCFSIDFVGENDISLNNSFPIPSNELEDFLSNETPYHFTITNKCSSLASATINLESLNVDSDKQLDDEWIDAILYETDYHSKLNKSTRLMENENNDANKVIDDAIHAYKLHNFTLKANEVKEYNLLVYMDEEMPLSEDTQNAGWKGKITLSTEYKYDQFANSGTLRQIKYSDTKGMWNYKDNITKIVIETKKKEKTAGEGQVVHGPFDESSTGDSAIQSYVICESDDTNCIGYLQGDGGVKLNSNSSRLFANYTKVTEIEGMQNFDTSSVTDMSSMFASMSNLQTIIFGENFDTSSVTDMSSMFSDMSNLQTIIFGENFDTSSVENMSHMFSDMSNLQTIIFGENFDTSSVENMSYMFAGMSQLQELDLSHFDTSSVKTMLCMFKDCISIKSLNLSSFNTSKVKSMQFMFSNCRQIQELDLSNFDTSSVNTMHAMFSGMSNLQNLTFGLNFHTNKVIQMSFMFSDCSQLQSLDLSHFDTSSVETMTCMFYNMTNIKELDLSSFNTSLVKDMIRMFEDTSNLKKITYGPNFVHADGLRVDNMFNRSLANKPNASVHSSWSGVF